MLFNLNPITIVINMLVLLIGMTIHEFAHNYVGWKMGDPVPKLQGRLTLNPFVHINWVGWLMFAIIGFGVLGSAPISAQRMRNPRWGFFAAVAAGPFSNLALAIVSALIIHVFNMSGGFIYYYVPDRILNPGDLISAFFYGMVLYNVLLFVFNLIPLFPIDGWHLVLSLLPGVWLNRMQIPVAIQQNVRPLSEFLKRPAFQWQAWSMASYYVLLGLIIISLFIQYMNVPIPSPLSIIISQPVRSITGFLVGM